MTYDFYLCQMSKGSLLNRNLNKLFPPELWIILFTVLNTIVSELHQTSPTCLLVMVGNKHWWVRNRSGQQPAAGLSAVTYCHHNHLQGHPQYEELFCQSSCTQLFIGWPGKLGIIFPVTICTKYWKVKACYQFATEAVRLPSQLQVPPTQHIILYNLGSYHQPHLSQWYV